MKISTPIEIRDKARQAIQNMQIIVTKQTMDSLFGYLREKTYNINGRAMTMKEIQVRSRAFDWINLHMWMTNEALKLTLLEDLEIEEIIELIEDLVGSEKDYPSALITELRRVA